MRTSSDRLESTDSVTGDGLQHDMESMDPAPVCAVAEPAIDGVGVIELKERVPVDR